MEKIHIGARIWKTVLAAFLCSMVGYFLDLQPFYMVIASILCLQNTTEKSIRIGLKRIWGTAIGGICSLLILLLIDFTPLKAFSIPYYILISLCIALVIYTTVLIHHEESAYIACVVFLSVVLSHYEADNHYLFALVRMMETVVGIAVAVIVNTAIKHNRLNEKS